MKPVLSFFSLTLIVLGSHSPILAGFVEYRIVDSHKPGPAIAVLGTVSEAGPAGVAAATQIVNWRPSRGKLVVLIEGRARHLLHHQPANRLGATSQWANSLGGVLNEVKPDWLIQLTEAYDAKDIIPEADGATIFGSGNSPGLEQQLSRMAKAAQSAGGADEPQWKTAVVEENSLLLPTITVVTSAKDARNRRLWSRTRQHRGAVHAFLSELNMRTETASLDEMMPAQKEGGRIRIAIYQGPGAVSSSGHDPDWIQQTLNEITDFQTALIGPNEIQSGGLAQFDVLLVGGGLSNRQSKGLGLEGRKAVVDFVRAGGGYVGICAGMFLASSDSDSRLHLLPIDVSGSSGIGKVRLDFNAEAEIQISGDHPAKFSGGPVAVRRLDPADESVRILAYFRSEPQDRKSKKPLTDTPAIVSGNYGAGRVFLFSPHCERYPGPRTAFYNALRWAGKSKLPLD